MTKHSLAFSLLAVCSIVIFFSACNKINEATDLGSGLIPPIDNINTFDTTLEVQAYNGLFTALEDSLALSNGSDIQFLGNINNDPLFGKTEASMYFELKPGSYKYSFPFSKSDLVALDSVVLVLGYSGTYGDSILPQQVGVYEIPTTQSFRFDSSYSIYKNNITAGSALGPLKTVIPQTLDDSVFPYNEKASNQLRIPLYNSFGQRLLNYDSTNAYATDSAFKTYFNGFAVMPQNNGVANALMGFSLGDTNTKLSLYVRYKNADKVDTAVINFRLTQYSASANYINRNYAGSQLASYQGGTEPDDLLFIQNTPGSYATIKIPGLKTLNNRIVHRAELIVEEVADPLDKVFTPPQYLYLDAYDSAKSSYGTIPYDLGTTPATGYLHSSLPIYQIANASAFGMSRKAATDASGNPISVWQFDLSRYVQHVVNNTQPAYTFRLSAPFFVGEAYRNGATDPLVAIPVNTNYAVGRVRVGGGNHAAQRMRLRVIYSKL